MRLPCWAIACSDMIFVRTAAGRDSEQALWGNLRRSSFYSSFKSLGIRKFGSCSNSEGSTDAHYCQIGASDAKYCYYHLSRLGRITQSGVILRLSPQIDLRRKRFA